MTMILFEGQDVEEVHEVVSTHFAPHRLRVIEDRELNGRFVTSHVGPVSVFTLGYGATVEVRPGELPDIYNIHVPLTGYGTLWVDGRQVATANSMVGPGQRLDMRWSADSDTLILRIVREAIDDALAKRLGETPATPIHFDADMHEATAGSWLAAARIFGESAAEGLFTQSPLAAAHFEQLLLQGLLDSQPHTLTDQLTESGNIDLPAVLRRAMAFCEERAGDPVSIADIAIAAHTGVRSLQRLFKTRLQMTPLEYLQRVRLDRAHQDLRTARGTVAEVAMRWGFTHLGRFSALYRKAYGQTPSETVRRSTHGEQAGSPGGQLVHRGSVGAMGDHESGVPQDSGVL
ncbi:AraC family transcriptional regulator [Kibdelosporangium aridum]|uniref:AraC family transcriptional regulator n=2 Tax=Kibdelosporangium aridum TaxID=2030 RepID=A0A428Z232_KIBAR|nr:AraC family transcriptional regulator [Kibdelosporangium aridum]